MRFPYIVGLFFLAISVFLTLVGGERSAVYGSLIVGNIWLATDFITESIRAWLTIRADGEHVWTAPHQRADQDYSARAASLSPAERAKAATERVGKKS